MSNETPAPFMPFVPPGSAPPTQPDGGPVENKPPRPPRKAKKKKAAVTHEFKPDAVLTPAAPRKRRAAKAKPARKYDLQTILRVAATFKEADQPVFEKLLGELTALAKGSRERVLKALGEVFG